MIDVSRSGQYIGDCRALLRRLPNASVQSCITSPPYYGLRDYGVDGQLGLEPTPDEYVANMVDVFREVRRVLRDDGTLWLNLGDSWSRGKVGRSDEDESSLRRRNRSYGTALHGKTGARGQSAGAARRARGLKDKDLIGIPWMTAFALRADGWYLRSDIVWAKPNPMPESVRDRPTKSHEYVFLLSKSETYFYNKDAVAERSTWAGQNRSSRAAARTAMPGAPPHRGLRNDQPTGTRNLRSVWTIAPRPYKGAHFATMPPQLAERCLLAGSREGDVVLDTFFGSGTVGMVAEQWGRRWIGFDINPAYEQLQRERIGSPALRLVGCG